uniref:RxLR effector candidate protein n=1 Tax=Hyaloperonospora arabidopsidis (strain Emoy2) TaxID=559515 RepID=M4C4G1_HYAAE
MLDSLVKLSSTRPTVLRLILSATLVYAILIVVWMMSSQQFIATTEQVEAEAHATTVQNLPREVVEAEASTVTVKNLSREALETRRFKCIGWRATHSCSADGARDVANDKECDERVEHTASGYCEIEDLESGERFRVMQRGCGTVRRKAKFLCSCAPDFANFPAKIDQVVEKVSAPGFSLPNSKQTEEVRAGIVMVVYPKLLAGAYASIRTLREVLRCRLPIEIWFRPDEMQNVPAGLKQLEEAAKVDTMDGVTFRAINDLRAVRFAAKVHAIYNSAFDQVLFLDADNVPVRDPAFLFESEEFVRTGAVFWPDFWHPQHTIFHLVEDSLLWQMLDMQYVDMFEQESGQLLIDRRRHAAAMELVHFYASHTPDLFKHLDLVWGDKDLFRFAWIKLNAPFFMVQTPPAVAGKLVNESFCGMTMVQHDFGGNVLFLHRNTNKLTGRRQRHNVNYGVSLQKSIAIKQPGQSLSDVLYHAVAQAKQGHSLRNRLATLEPLEPDNLPDPVIWTHLWSFRNSSRRNNYRVKSYLAQPEFPEWQRCYGERNIRDNEHFYAQNFADMSFSGLETHLRRFAMEGVQQLEKF